MLPISLFCIDIHKYLKKIIVSLFVVLYVNHFIYQYKTKFNEHLSVNPNVINRDVWSYGKIRILVCVCLVFRRYLFMTEDLFMTKVVVTKSGRSCAFLACWLVRIVTLNKHWCDGTKQLTHHNSKSTIFIRVVINVRSFSFINNLIGFIKM